MPAPEPLTGVRVVATPTALDGAAWTPGSTVFRIAEDEALVFGSAQPALEDPHALVVEDAGWCGLRMERAQAQTWLERSAGWRADPQPGSTIQGLVAGVPVKIRFDGEHALVVTRASLAQELGDQL